MSEKRARQKKKRAAKAAKASQRTAALGGERMAEVVKAARWPVSAAYAMDSWKTQGATTVLLFREHPEGQQTAAVVCFVDLWCLGVKYARFEPNTSVAELVEQFDPYGELIPCEPELVAAIIEAGAEYARSLGFPPSKELPLLREMLRGLDPSAVEAPPTGREGRPCFVPGPGDNPSVILAHLHRTLGEGGYDYIERLDGPDAFDDDDAYEDDL